MKETIGLLFFLLVVVTIPVMGVSMAKRQKAAQNNMEEAIASYGPVEKKEQFFWERKSGYVLFKVTYVDGSVGIFSNSEDKPVVVWVNKNNHSNKQ